MIGYFAHKNVEGGVVVGCPRKGTVKAADCRRKCRYFAGRGIIKFVDDFRPDEKRIPGEPAEHEVKRWHICNYPEDVDKR